MMVNPLVQKHHMHTQLKGLWLAPTYSLFRQSCGRAGEAVECERLETLKIKGGPQNRGLFDRKFEIVQIGRFWQF